jgi:peptidoglycan/xylan/chitin deacetylase (PgdA/CDA1 family)
VKVKRIAKRLLARGLVRTGWWDLMVHGWARRGTPLILTYHRVLEKCDAALDYAQPGLVVTAPMFERHLVFLKQHFDIVPLSALLRDDAARPSDRRPRCVITFDDGWRDNYDLAFPILRQHGIPAIIFLTTDFVGTARAFWHTELIALLLSGELSAAVHRGPSLAAYPKPVREELARCTGVAGPAGSADTDALVEAVKANCDETEIEDLIKTLTAAARLPRPLLAGRRFFLDWDQVREMAATGIEIGSHGCSHRIMTQLSTADVRDELVRSKAEIETRIGRPVMHFAFPNEDANPALTELASRAGYRTVCVGAGVEVASDSVLALRRVTMHEGVGVDGLTYDKSLVALSLLRTPKGRPV